MATLSTDGGRQRCMDEGPSVALRQRQTGWQWSRSHESLQRVHSHVVVRTAEGRGECEYVRKGVEGGVFLFRYTVSMVNTAGSPSTIISISIVDWIYTYFDGRDGFVTGIFTFMYILHTDHSMYIYLNIKRLYSSCQFRLICVKTEKFAGGMSDRN